MVLVVGHSHMDCLRKAAIERGSDLNCLYLWLTREPVIRDDGEVRLGPNITNRLEPEVVALVGGAAHDLLGLIRHPTPFDFVLPEQPDLPMDPDATIIPYAAAVAAVDGLIGGDEAELAGLIAATGCHVRQIESPPPSGNNSQLAPDISLIAKMWKRPLEADRPPSEPWLRYKLWRIHSTLVRQRCEAAGVEFVPVPEKALVDGAFLAPEFYAYPCHANAAYGALVLEQLGMLP